MNEQEEVGISIIDLLKILKSKVVLIISITFITFLIGSIYTFYIIEESYVSQTTIIVAVSDDNQVDIDNSFRIIQSISELIKQDRVLSSVVDKYATKNKEQEFLNNLKDNIEVISSSSSFLITIKVTDSSSINTMNYANEIANSLIDICNTDSTLKILFEDCVSVMSEASLGIYDSPNKLLYLTIFLFAGLFIGCSISFLIEFTSDKFKSINEVTRYINKELINSLNISNKVNALLNDDSINKQFSKVFTNIKYLNKSKYAYTVMILSTDRYEYKSLTTYYLSLCAMLSNKKVLIIDLNNNSFFSSIFNIESNIGILDYINGNCSYKEIINSVNNIDIITTGNISNYNILDSKELINIIKEAKLNYEYIFIDSPSINESQDVFSISKQVDGLLYNICLNKYKKDLIIDNINRLKRIDSNIIGVNIINKKV